MGQANQKSGQIVFAVAAETIIVGIPQDAWDHMKTGKTNTFNLRSIGLPFNLVIFGGKSRAHVLDTLKPTLHPDAKVDTESDYSIPEDEQAIVRLRRAAQKHMRDRFLVTLADDDADKLVNAIIKSE